MRWARLLHASDRVEVLEFNKETERVRIRRHGFIQEVSSHELVFEEEPSCLLAATPPAASSKEGVTLNLHLIAGNPEVTLLLCRDDAIPAYIGLYLRVGTNPMWHPIWQEIFTAGVSRFSKLSQAIHAPPWTFRLCVLPLVNEPSDHLPEVQLYEATLRPLFFARSGVFPIEWGLLPILKGSKNPIHTHAPEATSVPPISTYHFPRANEIDLHIEKLAPQLASASGEEIFLYQKEVLEQYLDWAFREKLPFVRVIHGKGMLKLKQLLLELCKQNNWKAETLITPPYSGGATKVSF